ncbi:hypothetical protein [Nocardia sp. NPDC004711]
MIGDHDHLFAVGQVDPDDRIAGRDQGAQPVQARVTVAITPGQAITVVHGTSSLLGRDTKPYKRIRRTFPTSRHRRTERLSMPHSALTEPASERQAKVNWPC